MRETAAAAKECPQAPPARASVYARALHRACLIVGGVEQLANHLDVDGASLERWLRGDEPPPETIFLAAVEMVLLHVTGSGRAH